jgi:hypothetical protein
MALKNKPVQWKCFTADYATFRYDKRGKGAKYIMKIFSILVKIFKWEFK